MLRHWILGTILTGLFAIVPAARADVGDVLLGTAVGAGVASAIDDDDDGYYYGRRYRSFSPYGYSYRSYPSYRYRSFREVTPVYRYRAFAPGLPFGASYYVDQGGYRNYKDAYGNHLGRQYIGW